ncbi:antibiotic biosynthesis monooxygenase [Gordonia sp. TBRC 11910]|uniref:Antibiotic biosynthesis monooxygenase n=1 Tax=Gordonia asplenii TaxID=2725283 RepID=A0A848KSJ6_9ACTN|nr:putative quinol monooxygenase [Gordonia asplenii]NMO01410.1 antibiotic biosynthesis monooxygenase [Gordonia asplenii]
MIFIVVKFNVGDDHLDTWLTRTAAFTEATRAEPGNLWFDWFQSVEDPNEFALVEAFADAEAGAAHVSAKHFAEGLAAMRPALTQTPRIISREIDGDGWSAMGELEIG